MADPQDRHLARQLRLTRLGLWAERLTRALWPAWTATFLAVAIWASGLAPDLWEASLLGAVGILALVLLVLGLRGFETPTAADARARLDATLPGRPLAALSDDLAIGGRDAGASAVWAAHRARMATRVAGARAVPPDLRVSRRDPYALRYMAVLVMAVGLLFGAAWRAPVLPDMPGGALPVASGPAWEGWLAPPRHTGRPTLYLADIPPGAVEVPVGTLVTLRLYGEPGTLAVSETVSGRSVTDPGEPMQDFAVTRSGTLSIDGLQGAAPLWTLSATPDAAPEVTTTGEAAFEQPDDTTLPWRASDDHGVVAAEFSAALDPDGADRRHGLAVEPEPREALTLEMPLPITGDRAAVEDTFRADLMAHPLAGMPVTVTLTVRDDAGQAGTHVEGMVLPGRPFYAPIAAALVEQRRDILWSRANRVRASRLLKAVTWQADDDWDNPGAYLLVRMAIRRLDAGPLTPEARDEVAEMLWEAAVRIEDTSLDSALERLRQAQDRLSEAIRQGAPPEEIERLMAEMRQAMDEYTRQLAQQGGQQGQQQQAEGETQQVTPDMLDEMMRRIEELMAEGRTAEAQELLRQLQEMMENLQVAEGGQGGKGGPPSPGQQAMDELRDQLREQQELSDDAFRELQEQFDGDRQGQDGEQPGEGEQPGQGQQPGQGRQPGQGQQSGQGQQPGQGQGQGERSTEPGGGGTDARSLARRQEALRRGIGELRDGLPGAGTEAGEAARDALDRAEGAMGDAERDLAQGDLGGALDDQSRAMDALRDGMQALGRALAGEPPQDGDGEGRGQADARDGRALDRDPLGRQSGEGGQLGTQDDLLTGEDAMRRSRDLLDEIRRRSGERERPQPELDYLRRLLERF